MAEKWIHEDFPPPTLIVTDSTMKPPGGRSTRRDRAEFISVHAPAYDPRTGARRTRDGTRLSPLRRDRLDRRRATPLGRRLPPRSRPDTRRRLLPPRRRRDEEV